jgi:hypothetical protein
LSGGAFAKTFQSKSCELWDFISIYY